MTLQSTTRRDGGVVRMPEGNMPQDMIVRRGTRSNPSFFFYSKPPHELHSNSACPKTEMGREKQFSLEVAFSKDDDDENADELLLQMQVEVEMRFDLARAKSTGTLSIFLSDKPNPGSIRSRPLFVLRPPSALTSTVYLDPRPPHNFTCAGTSTLGSH